MAPTTRRILTAVAVASLVLSAHLASAQAARKKKVKRAKPACGIKYLPLVEGNTWIYEPMDPPEVAPGQAAAAPGKRKRWATVKPPDKVTIRVTKIEPDGKKATVITLEETAGADTRTVKLRCSKAGLEVSPQSFFFSGSPGGGYLMELSNLTRTGKPFPSGRAGLRATTGWTETINADVTRTASKPVAGAAAVHPAAKLTVERSVLIEGIQPVAVSSGNYPKATRVRIDLSGRATIMEPTKRVKEIPAAQVGILWFANNVGVVQTRDSAGRWFQLTSTVLK